MPPSIEAVHSRKRLKTQKALLSASASHLAERIWYVAKKSQLKQDSKVHGYIERETEIEAPRMKPAKRRGMRPPRRQSSGFSMSQRSRGMTRGMSS